jgi:gamma-glutamylcyclotransferase (GGCT)/AIG2-like uncharacterized protein YtfP
MQALFIYGTLHPNRAPAQISATTSQLKHLTAATVTGQLLDLGDYPGFITHGEQNTIPGDLFQLPEDPTETWQALDAYEGFYPDDLRRSLFRREPIQVILPNGAQQQHWIYLYNQPLP